MKICIDCKFHKITSENFKLPPIGPIFYQRPHGFSFDKNSCARLSAISMVTGEYFKPYLNCETERENELRLEASRCGYEGKYWEEKA